MVWLDETARGPDVADQQDVTASAWREVMSQPTFATATCLQWFLPVRPCTPVADANAGAASALGVWSLQSIRKRDLRSYEQSLAKVIEQPDPIDSDGTAASAVTDGVARDSRVRILRFDPDPSWSGEVEKYDDGFRRLFQVTGTKLDPEPEVVRIGLFEFDSGEATSHYLGITMRYPIGRASPSKPAWTLGDIVDLNHQLVGSEMGGEPDESDDALLGTVQPTASWSVVVGSGSPDATRSMPWMQFVKGVMCSESSSPDRAIGPFAVDASARAVCMSVVVADGEIDRASAIRVAEHLGASMVSTTLPDRPLGVHVDGVLPASLFERSDRRWYVVTQRSTALVIDPNGVAPERRTYLRETLPKEYQTQNPLLYLLALHQKRALGHIIDSLSDIDLVGASDVAGLDGTGTGGVGDTLDRTGAQLAKLRKTQQAFHQLQAWTRYRLVSPRFGTQGFYDLVCDQHRIQDIYADVDNIIDGLESFLRVQLSELEQRITRDRAESQRRFERRVQLFGAVFASVAVVLAYFSINIRGVTAEGEGIDSGFALAIAAVGLLVVVAAFGVWAVSLVRRRSDTAGRARL